MGDAVLVLGEHENQHAHHVRQRCFAAVPLEAGHAHIPYKEHPRQTRGGSANDWMGLWGFCHQASTVLGVSYGTCMQFFVLQQLIDIQPFLLIFSWLWLRDAFSDLF